MGHLKCPGLDRAQRGAPHPLAPVLRREQLAQPFIDFELEDQVDAIDHAAIFHRMRQAYVHVPCFAHGHRETATVKLPHDAAVRDDWDMDADPAALEAPALTAE